MSELNKKVAIYIPSTVDVNSPADATVIASWVRRAKLTLAKLYGGFTVYSAQGGWHSPSLGLVEENVTIVQSFTDYEGLHKLGEVRAFASEMAKELSQEAVSVEVDGVLTFVGVSS